MKPRRISILFCLLSISLFRLYAQEPHRSSKETLLSRTPLHALYNNSYSISANLRHIAFILQQGKQFVAVVDTLAGPAFDSVGMPVFSADGRHFCYSARKGVEFYLLLDHHITRTLAPGTSLQHLQFTPDDQLLYILLQDKKQYLFSGNKKSGPYDAINENSIRFSSKGMMAYSATLNGKQLNVIGKQEGKAYDDVGFVVFNRDGSKAAYRARKGLQQYVVQNGKISSAYDWVGDISFSQDGRHILYDIKLKDQHLIVLDSLKGQSHEFLHSYILHPNGKEMAYGISKPESPEHEFTEYVMDRGKEEGPYEQVLINSLVFSPDGKELVYGAQLPLIKELNGLRKEVDAYEWFIVRNGKMQTRYNMLQGAILFSPDGRHLAYGAERDIKRLVNLDGKEGPLYDDLYQLQFSSDSRHLAYTVRSGKQVTLVLDGKDGAYYDDFPGQKEFRFDSNNSFHYLAIRGDELFVVEERFE